MKEALEMQRKQEEEEKQRAELGPEILDPLDSDSEYVDLDRCWCICINLLH